MIDSPTNAAKLFFVSLNNGDRKKAWNLLSCFSQKRIIEMIFKNLQTADNVPDESKKISKEQIGFALENDVPGLAQDFWFSFSEASYVKSISNHAEFIETAKLDTSVIVEIIFKLPDLNQISIPLKMILENSDWKVGYIESEG